MKNALNPIGKLTERYKKAPYVKALLQLLPGWGVADTLIQHRAEEIRIDRMRTFFDELASGKVELTEELISTEDYLHCYFSTLRAATFTRQREKIRMLARLLKVGINNMVRIPTDEYEELLSVLDAITLREFNVLNDLYNYEQNYPKVSNENDLQNSMRYWPEAISQITSKHEIPREAFEAFLAKLERTGLYLRITGGFMSYKGDVGRTTPLFKRLIEFVNKEDSSKNN